MDNKSIGSVGIRGIIRMNDKGLLNNQLAKNLGKIRTNVIKYLGGVKVLFSA
jgi:hypothetical protein